MQSFDPINESTCLFMSDISKSCAKQRAGRAGRVQNGFVYRLYSADHFKRMAAHTVPEIQRVSLAEICLKAKDVAPNVSIESFLNNGLEPPSSLHIRQVRNYFNS